jgi:NitT/TauT family transport system permease protein
VIWFGYGMTSKVIISAAIAFFTLWANIIGLRAAPRDEVEFLIALTASRWQIFASCNLPRYCLIFSMALMWR